MSQLPTRLKTTIPATEFVRVEDWWEKLSEENKLELSELYEEEIMADKHFVSIYLCGRYVEQEQTKPHYRFWINHFYEYLVNHEVIVHGKPAHVGGICSANLTARLAFQRAFLPAEFCCPEKNPSCLMRQLLEPGDGRPLQLFLRFELAQNSFDPNNSFQKVERKQDQQADPVSLGRTSK